MRDIQVQLRKTWSRLQEQINLHVLPLYVASEEWRLVLFPRHICGVHWPGADDITQRRKLTNEITLNCTYTCTCKTHVQYPISLIVFYTTTKYGKAHVYLIT